MKNIPPKIILLLLAILYSLNLSAQNYEYDYDNNGNRIHRQIVELKNMQANNNLTDSTPAIQKDKLSEMDISVLTKSTQDKLVILRQKCNK